MVKRAYPKVLARLAEGEAIRAVGREAETLLMLLQKGSAGVRAYDFAFSVARHLMNSFVARLPVRSHP